MIYSVQIGARYQDREVGQIACLCDSESFENAPVNMRFQTGLMRSFGASSYVRHVRTGKRHTHTHTHTHSSTLMAWPLNTQLIIQVIILFNLHR